MFSLGSGEGHLDLAPLLDVLELRRLESPGGLLLDLRLLGHADGRLVVLGVLLPGALDYSRAGFCAGGLTTNREFFGPHVYIGKSVPPEVQNVLFDPQTSGGLLIFCQAQDAGALLADLHAANIDAVEIGSTAARGDHLLTVT